MFTDCFNQSGAASEAAFGLTLLAGLSLVIDFIPVVGDAKGLVEAATGRDLLTGEELADWERAVGLIGLIPGADLLRLVGVGADAAGAAGSVARAADGSTITRNLDGTSTFRYADGTTRTHNISADGAPTRVGDDVGVPDAPETGTPRADGSSGGEPPRGDTPQRARDGDEGLGDGATPARSSGGSAEIVAGSSVPHGTNRPRIDDLSDQYRNATDTADATRQTTRTRLSEEIGELGAVDHLQDITGRDVGILRPTSDADVADLIDRFDDGVAWDDAVAFNGRNVTNIVYFDGQTLHIIEAKGGASTFGDRVSSTGRGGPDGRISQTDPEYPLDVSFDMQNSGINDGRNGIGALVEDAYDTRSVRYSGVRTSGHQVGNSPTTVVENVFRTAGN